MPSNSSSVYGDGEFLGDDRGDDALGRAYPGRSAVDQARNGEFFMCQQLTFSDASRAQTGATFDGYWPRTCRIEIDECE